MYKTLMDYSDSTSIVVNIYNVKAAEKKKKARVRHTVTRVEHWHVEMICI